MSGSEFGWIPEQPDEEMQHLRDRAARQHVESLVLRLSGDLGTHPDHLRRLIEAEIGMPIWEAHPDQLRGCAAALEAVRRVLRDAG
ncbi:MAG: hypothetical protein ACRDMV_24030 [Streptosporangiales bacterium]